jgi:hypothetical protein
MALRFNGILTISWNSFQSADSADIVTQSVTVKVVAGILRVQLVPSPTFAGRLLQRGLQQRRPGAIPGNLVGAVEHRAGSRQRRASHQPVGRPDRRPIPAVRAAAPSRSRNVTGSGCRSGGAPARRVRLCHRPGGFHQFAGIARRRQRQRLGLPACGRLFGRLRHFGTHASFVDGDSPAGIVDGSNTTFTLSANAQPGHQPGGISQRHPAKSDPGFHGHREHGGIRRRRCPAARRHSARVLPPGRELPAAVRSLTPHRRCCAAERARRPTGVSMAAIGACAIPSGILLAGDRVEIHFDLAHTGTASGFTFEVDWAATPILNRSGRHVGRSGDRAAPMRPCCNPDRSSVRNRGALSYRSAPQWRPSTDAYASGITISFQGMLARTGDTLALANYTVIRIP